MPIQKNSTSMEVPMISQGMVIGGNSSSCSSDLPRNS